MKFQIEAFEKLTEQATQTLTKHIEDRQIGYVDVETWLSMAMHGPRPKCPEGHWSKFLCSEEYGRSPLMATPLGAEVLHYQARRMKWAESQDYKLETSREVT